MNSAEQLNAFLQRITSDANLTTMHVGICTTLAVTWMNNELNNPFHVSRGRLMNAAKIKSKTTYHKVINDLASLNYLKYTPSFHPGKASQFLIL